MVSKDSGKAEEAPQEPSQIMDKPLPSILADMDENMRKAAQAAIEAAVEEATTKIENVATKAREAANMAADAANRAEEAYNKASEALPTELIKRLLGSRQFLLLLLALFLSTIFAAAAISLGLSLVIR